MSSSEKQPVEGARPVSNAGTSTTPRSFILAGISVIAGTAVFFALDGGTTISLLDGALAVLALGALAFAARSTVRADHGAAIAWGVCALPFAPLLFLLALPFLRISTVLGNCDPMNDICEYPVAGAWVPAVLYLAFGILTIGAVRANRRAARHVAA